MRLLLRHKMHVVLLWLLSFIRNHVILVISFDDIHCFLEDSCSIFLLSRYSAHTPANRFHWHSQQIEITFSTIGRKREMETRINFTVAKEIDSIFPVLSIDFFFVDGTTLKLSLFFSFYFLLILLIYIAHCTFIHSQMHSDASDSLRISNECL